MTGEEAIKTIEIFTKGYGIDDYIAAVKKDINRLKKLERYLKKWYEQLAVDGVNSKSMVRNDIQFLLKED